MADVTVTKRGRVWQYRFDTAKIAGKRRQVSKSGFRTKAEAQTAGLEAYMQYKNQGMTYSHNKMSVADYLDLWFKEYCEKSLKYNTQYAKLNYIEKWLKPYVGRYQIDDLTPAVVDDLVLYIKQQKLANGTKKEILITFKAAITYAYRILKILPLNPCQNMTFRRYGQTTAPKEIITPEQFQRILQKFPEGTRWHVPLMLGYHTGLRKGEVFALTWDDINFDKGTLTVNKQIQQRRNVQTGAHTKNDGPRNWYIIEPKTQASHRVIHLDSALLALLKRTKEAQDANRARLGGRYKTLCKIPEFASNGDVIYKVVEVDEDVPVRAEKLRMIIVAPNGHYLTHNNICNCMDTIKNELGINCSFHALRHTHATILVQHHVDIKTVQARLGHSSAVITLDTYAHATEEGDRKAVGFFERFWKESQQMCTDCVQGTQEEPKK